MLRAVCSYPLFLFIAKIQILLSHPFYDKSRANRAPAENARKLAGAEVTHLEELYPDGNIDVDAEVAGRPFLLAATSGDKPAAYAPDGANLFPLAKLLRPLHSTAHRSGLVWRDDPFLTYETPHASDEALREAGRAYADRLPKPGGA